MASPEFLGEAPSTFSSLLRQLEKEHQRQLSLVRRDTERLLTELNGSEGLDGYEGGATYGLDSQFCGPTASVCAPAALPSVPAADSAIAANSTLARETLPSRQADDLATAPASAADDAVGSQSILVSESEPLPVQGESAVDGHAAMGAQDARVEQSGGGGGPEPPLGFINSDSAVHRALATARPHFAQREVWTSGYMDDHELPIKHQWRSRDRLPSNHFQARERCSIKPNSSAKLAWDVTGMLLLIWDMIAIPFTLAFEPEEGWFLTSLGWATLIFWTVDMGLACSTAYYDNGVLVTSPNKILWHYLTSWFVLDCCIVGLDWFMTIAGLLGGGQSKGGGSIVGLGRLLRGLRVMRVLRLMRLAKLKQVAQRFYDLIDTEYTFLVIKLMRLMATILFINHFVCCLWFSIGNAGSDEVPHWLDKLTHEPGEPRSAERLVWEYSTSLHWSLCQFTPAGMEIVSVNTQERVFSCLIVFFAMGIFTSVVASVSASMAALRSMNDETSKQFWLLRRYLTQNAIGTEVRERILRYLEHKVHQEVGKVKPPLILGMLSEPLRQMLAGALIERHMMQHPFFRNLHNDAERIMHLLCHQAFITMAFAEDDVIFSTGHVAESMFIPGERTEEGDLTYKFPRHDPVPVHIYEHGVFIAEGVLWTHWKHLGDLSAARPCSLLIVMPVPFAKVVSGDPKSWNAAKSYSEKYVQFLNEQALLTDIGTEDEDEIARRASSHLKRA